MTTILDTGLENVKDLYINSIFFGYEWLLAVIFMFVTMLLITRNPHTWKKLALPIVTLYGTMGMMVSPLVYTLTGFMFVFGIFNSREIGNLITAGNKTLTVDNMIGDEARMLKNITKATEKRLLSKSIKDRVIINDSSLDKLISRNKGYKTANILNTEELKDFKKKIRDENLAEARRIKKENNIERLKQIANETRARVKAFEREKKAQNKKNVFNDMYSDKYFNSKVNNYNYDKKNITINGENISKNMSKAYQELVNSGVDKSKAWDQVGKMAKEKYNLK